MKELILIYTNRAKLDTYINYLTTHSIPIDDNKKELIRRAYDKHHAKVKERSNVCAEQID